MNRQGPLFFKSVLVAAPLGMAFVLAQAAPAWAHRQTSTSRWQLTEAQLAQVTPSASAGDTIDEGASTDESASDAPVSGAADGARGPVAADTGFVYHHRHQFGFAIIPGVGYRIVVPYGDPESTGIDCLDASGKPKRVCTAKTPFFIDGQVSFGITQRLDLLADVRFGLERDNPGGAPRGGAEAPFSVAPGLRVWLDQDAAVKFYTTIQGVFDYTEQNNPNVSKSDFGFRNANGLMYDPIRNVGFFLQIAETFGFKRWFRIEMDVGLGVQVRFP